MFLTAHVCYLAIRSLQKSEDAELIGAAEIVRQLKRSSPPPPRTWQDGTLLQDVKTYARTSDSMTPHRAAKGWLALLEKAESLPAMLAPGDSSPPPLASFLTVASVLPRPAAWPEIAETFAMKPPTRKNKIMQMLFARLEGNDRVVRKLVEELSRPLPGEPKPQGDLAIYYLYDYPRVKQGLDARAADTRRDAQVSANGRAEQFAMQPAKPDPSDPTALKYALLQSDEPLMNAAIAIEAKKQEKSDELSQALLRLKRYREAEKLELGAARGPYEVGLFQAIGLCRVYYAADRPQDIVTLLSGYPFWVSSDLADLLTVRWPREMFGRDDKNLPFGLYAAWALAKTGRRSLAVEALRQLLWEMDYCDEAYGLLNEIDPVSAMALYDALARAHPDEPRPLVWKADLLYRRGKLAQAEAVARHAIALDPCDSRSGPRHRLRAYPILGSILKKKGDLAGALDCDRMVRAGALSDRALELAEIGQNELAIDIYKQSLNEWPDDFITLERLAQCLQESRPGDSSPQYLRRAFEAMPACVGPGTEFPPDVEEFNRGASVRTAAALAMKDWSSTSESGLFCRAWYEGAAGKSTESARDLRRVVALDPAYYSAWRAMSDLGRDQLIAHADAEAAAYKLLELGPQDDGFFLTDFAQVGRIADAYRAIQAQLSKLPKPRAKQIFHLHSGTENEEPGSAPWQVMELQFDRPTGSYLSMGRDIGEIINHYDQLSYD